MGVGSFWAEVDGFTAEFGGFLRCETCGLRGEVEARYWRVGWPKHCGYTMRWWTQRQVDAGEVAAFRSMQ